MRIRKAFAVAAIAAFAFVSGPVGEGWNAGGQAFAKQSNGNAGGNGNSDNGAGNGNGQAAAKANIAPVADAGADRAVVVGQAVVLDGSGSYDGDGDPVEFTWEITVRPIDSQTQLDDPHAVRPRFVVDVAGDYEIQLTLDDGLVASAAVSVLVSTGNLPPAGDAGADLAVTQGGSAVLDGTKSADPNGDAVSFSWRLVTAPEGSAAEIADSSTPRPSLFADLDGDYVAELSVDDGWAVSAPDRVTISTGNVAPAANAGVDLDADGGLVALEAELSADANGDELSFRWTVLKAPESARYRIRNSTERRAFLAFEDPGDYVMQLTATDSAGAVGFDTALVSAGNVAPVADAGPDRAVEEGEHVRLDASGSSDANGDLLTAHWSLVSVPADSAAALEGANSVRSGFVADVAGTYIAQLIVDDGTQASAPDTVVISSGNLAPVADAGPDLWVEGTPGESVVVNGGGSSDANGDALTYRWSLVDAPRGSKALLAGAESVAPTFTPDRAGTYLMQLVVGDGMVESAPDMVVIAKGYGGLEPGPGVEEGDGNNDGAPGWGHDTNLRPVADAGADQTVPGGSFIQLEGAGSYDPNGHVIHYDWALIFKPAGSEAALSDPAAVAPSFSADVSGIYVAQLTVRDAQIESFPDTVLIYANTAPVADAGPDREVVLGSTVALDGTGSYDDDRDPLTYRWSFASKPAGSNATIDNAASALASFTPDLFGDYVVRLIVNDGVEDSAPDTATITTINNPPLAEAGDDQWVKAGDRVTLDGTGSSDPDGQSLSYSWRFTARPAGSAAAFDDPNSATPAFTADVEGLYIAELTVNDGIVDSSPDVAGVRAGPVQPNRAPALDAIGPQTVVLGRTLTLQLNATDPDGDAVYYFADPMPLPANMTLDARTGELVFRPQSNQVGEIQLTLGASDGALRDSESVLVTVMPLPIGLPTSLTGRMLDANANEAGEIAPIAGASVLLYVPDPKKPGKYLYQKSTATDAQGNFYMLGTPSGELQLRVSASGYQTLNLDVALAPNTLNALGNLYLAQVNTDAKGYYGFWPWARDGLRVTDNTSGVSVYMPKRLTKANGFGYRGWFYVSPAPYEAVASLVPDWISPCQVMSLSADPNTFRNFSATVTMQNRDLLPPGSELDIWNLNPVTNRFQVTGIGRVSADGATVSGPIAWPSLFFASPPAPQVAASADMNAQSLTPTLLADGNVSQAISLPGVMSLGQDRSQTLVYNSAFADPRPIVAMDTTILARTGLPATIDSALEVGGVTVAGPFRTDTQSPTSLPEDTDATIRHSAQFDAGELATGIHAYRFKATANYACSQVSAYATGEFPVNNQSSSPFGAGWTLAGLQRLHVQEDGDILLAEGDGNARVFDENPRPNYLPPVGIPAGNPGAGVLDDFNGDGHLDMAVPEMANGQVAVLLGDGAGGFPVDNRFTAGTGPVKIPLDPTWYPDVTTTATGDFNNDGKRDLLVSVQMSGVIRLYIGNGDGSFAAPTNFWRSRPQGLAVGDFDDDGNDDFVVGTLDGNTTKTNYQTYVYFGDGTGSFPADRIQNFTVPWPSTPVVADFDNNGALDIAVASAPNITVPSKIVVALNDGTGYFGEIAETPTDYIRNTTGRFPLATADFNGDGNADLALTVREANYFTVYFGNGLGGFFQQMRVTSGVGETTSLTATDYDEDGDVDVIASGAETAAIVLFQSDGAGGLSIQDTVPVGSVRLASVRAGDFNNDGAPDLQTGDLSNIYVLMADRSAARRFASPGADFSTLERTADGGYIRRMTDGTVMEFNADGLMTAMVDANGNRTEYAYDGSGLLSSISDPADPTRATVFDYSGDGIEAITDLAGRTSYFQVDGQGNLVSFQDAESNVFRYAYDGDSRLSAFASARGFVTSFDYGFAGQYLGTNNPDGTSVTASVTGSLGLVDPGLETGAWVAPEDRVATLQDAKGNIYEFEVNEYGAMVRMTDPIGRTTLVERDGNNLVTRTIAPSDSDPSGTVVTELGYDERGNVTAKTEAAGTALARTTRFEYEPDFNRTVKVIDPAGGETAMSYDPANGNLLSVTDAGGGTQSFTYDARGLRLTATDQNGNVTSFVYDFYGNIQTSTNGAGDVTKMVRDAAGNMVGVTEGFETLAERTTAYVFDDLGRTVQLIDPDGGVTETVYDADGNIIAEIDETGIASETEYDEMGRVAAEIHPATGRVTKTWDENGNMESIIDPTGNVAHFQYDAVNRAVRSENAAGGIRAFAYDAQDKPIEVVDANGNATLFKYDALGRQIERRNAVGDVWTFAYDSRDNMVKTVDAKGQRIAKVFDELNRMTRMVLYRADGSIDDDHNFAYDAMGQKVMAWDRDSSLAWSYDGANRVATAATQGGVGNAQPATELTHSYNAVGERVSLSDSEGGVTWYDHDSEGRLTRVMTAAGEVIDLDYDPAGRLTRIANPNAVETQVLYESATGQPATISTSQGQVQLLQLAYGFDTDGKITSIADNGGTRNFTYDETLQLTGGGYASAPESYAYDPEGNRTSSHLSGYYKHDTANRLRETEQACYDYDANGNLISKMLRDGLECTGAQTTYTWDVLNRLVRIDNPDGTYSAYRYDAQGRRIEKDVDGALTRYVYDGDAILLEYARGNRLQARYTHGEEIDQPLSMTRGGESYFYGTDHLGSVRLVTDAAGAVANRYDYDSVGNWEDTSYETVANPYGFTARERDAESGLMFYRARYYDPEIGRFISEDPIGFEGKDLNLYRYVFNDPLLLSDPLGLSSRRPASWQERLAEGFGYMAEVAFWEIGYALGYVASYAGSLVLKSQTYDSLLPPLPNKYYIAGSLAIAFCVGVAVGPGARNAKKLAELAMTKRLIGYTVGAFALGNLVGITLVF